MKTINNILIVFFLMLLPFSVEAIQCPSWLSSLMPSSKPPIIKEAVVESLITKLKQAEIAHDDRAGLETFFQLLVLSDRTSRLQKRALTLLLKQLQSQKSSTLFSQTAQTIWTAAKDVAWAHGPFVFRFLLNLPRSELRHLKSIYSLVTSMDESTFNQTFGFEKSEFILELLDYISPEQVSSLQRADLKSQVMKVVRPAFIAATLIMARSHPLDNLEAQNIAEIQLKHSARSHVATSIQSIADVAQTESNAMSADKSKLFLIDEAMLTKDGKPIDIFEIEELKAKNPSLTVESFKSFSTLHEKSNQLAQADTIFFMFHGYESVQEQGGAGIGDGIINNEVLSKTLQKIPAGILKPNANIIFIVCQAADRGFDSRKSAESELWIKMARHLAGNHPFKAYASVNLMYYVPLAHDENRDWQQAAGKSLKGKSMKLEGYQKELLYSQFFTLEKTRQDLQVPLHDLAEKALGRDQLRLGFYSALNSLISSDVLEPTIRVYDSSSQQVTTYKIRY